MSLKMSKAIRRQYKYCIVPGCASTSVTAPDKMFISLPTDINARRLWQEAMKRTNFVGDKSHLFVCEDHFNLEEDMKNFMYFKVMKNVPIKMKPGVVPHIFDCQKDRTALCATATRNSLKNKQLQDIMEESSSSLPEKNHKSKVSTKDGVNTDDIPEDFEASYNLKTEEIEPGINHQCSYECKWQCEISYQLKREDESVYEAKTFHAAYEPIKYQCELCLFKSNFKLFLCQHLRNEHESRDVKNVLFNGPKRLKCNFCQLETESNLFLIKHYEKCKNTQGINHKSITKVGLSKTRRNNDQKYVRPTVLKRTHRNEFHCDSCSYKTKLKTNLDRHVICKHTSADEINYFHCDICSYKGKHKQTLQHHIINKHTSANEISYFHCDTCSYKAKDKGSLKSHVMHKHTSSSEISYFYCDKCSYKAKARRVLNGHIFRKHTPANEIDYFHCELCSYKAKHKVYLKLHIRNKHTSANEIDYFNCDKCSYETKHKSALRAHMKNIHASENEINFFYCDECSYKAKKRSGLKRHVISRHTSASEINYFHCDTCSYKAKEKQALKRHINYKHTAANETNYFYCETCPYKTKHKFVLKGHMKNKHAFP